LSLKSLSAFICVYLRFLFLQIILLLVTRLRNKRLWLALGAYAGLALLAYLTLDGAFRAMVWIFCAGLTVMTLARALLTSDS
jgi:hypothetical protein